MHLLRTALILACPFSAVLLGQAPVPAASGTLDAATLSRIQSGRIAPAYPVPYAPATAEQIKAVLDRVLGYLETASPVSVIDRDTKAPVTDLTKLPEHPIFARTDFLLTSYEWGVTYAGMVHAAQITGDQRYRDYVATRLNAITTVATHLSKQPQPAAEATPGPQRMMALRPVIKPHTLDDSGSMCAGMIKASRAGISPETLRPWIDNYMNWISTGQYRFPDGTLARQGPMSDTLWLDDLYMSVPALAQMGALTGDGKYLDDAVRQIVQFSDRMFVREKNLYRHGWVLSMEPHPAFHWARANGWAIVAMTELLEVLPENHPGHPAVLALYRDHARGLATLQDGAGLWHQLLDRPDSYLETSASAMYVYSIAHGINRGWLDAKAYGAMVSLAWNAVAQKVNDKGQVEGTCVGTGMGFDPMFYYYRPTSVLAAHGYGPVLLAGAEMIALGKRQGSQVVTDGGVHYKPAAGR